ncbi:Fanconi anemia group D2 protein, partial [Spiromyces aspiralis]
MQTSAAMAIGALNLLLGFLVKIAKFKLLQITTKTPTSVGRKSKHPTLPGNELQSGTCGSSVANASPSYVFAELARLLPSVLRHLHSALDLYGNIEDLPSEMERVAGLVEFSLQYLESLLGWDGLANSSDSEKYRRAVLSALTLQGRKTSKSELSGLPLSILASRSFDYLLGLTESLQDIACVMRVNRILHCLAQWGSPASESKEARASMTTEDLERTMFHRLGMLAEQIMAGRWRNDDTLKPAEVEKLVLQRIEHSQDPLELIHDYSVQVLPSFLAGRSSGGSPGALGDEEWRHVLLTKSTLALFYRALSKALVDQISEFQTTNFDHTIYLPRLKTLIWSWHALVQLVKGRDDLRPLLQTCLKFGQRWVERFMRVVLPYLDTYFGAHYESIIALFGKLQKATRMLQVICGHGKIVRDKSMMAQVPVVRRALETFLFKVKALFDRHNVLSAFSLANLKHRNLAGEVVSSQMPEADEDEGLSSGSGGEEEEDDEREKAH